ncbi:unnamed protein product [Nesidiocoris tenuis]|uniref:Amino acid transporter n=1 Tax=Nesidiocoris tenuis TaxID=355587 RepID=A0A6H5H5X3_9HEMI|nr:unnamed protein product [Nesidiocoris tenuis]
MKITDFRKKLLCRTTFQKKLKIEIMVVSLMIIMFRQTSKVDQSFGRPSSLAREVMYVQFPGDLFLRMLKGLIIPLLVASVTAAIGSLDLSLSKKIGGRAIAYYMATTFIAVIEGSIQYFTIDSFNLNKLRKTQGVTILLRYVTLVGREIVLGTKLQRIDTGDGIILLDKMFVPQGRNVRPGPKSAAPSGVPTSSHGQPRKRFCDRRGRRDGHDRNGQARRRYRYDRYRKADWRYGNDWNCNVRRPRY